MKILFIGDVVGHNGRKTLKALLPEIVEEKKVDVCIANCENSANGSGLTYMLAQEFYSIGIDAITLGNHTWSKSDIIEFIDNDKRIVRPANYPKGVPGRGSTVICHKEGNVAVINALGRVYMDPVDCPFKSIEEEIENVKEHAKIIVVDIHAEATSEKNAIGWYFDGRVSCVIGTHTHVQTADERILPGGTGYLTDVGMTGPYNGIIGVDREIITKKFIYRMPAKFEVARGVSQLNAVVIDVDENTGKTLSIERILKIYDKKNI